ncbi:hypothetical protein IZY60_04885 [Lutibacter sp. B2]|nr:hypothetical protein [Lutibacter sp. B2]
MNRRKIVEKVLAAKMVDYIPKGEIVITDGFINQFKAPHLENVLEYLGSDIVTISINSTKEDWKYWRNKEYFVFGLVQGPFTYLLEKMGFHSICKYIVKKPNELEEMMNEYLKKMVNNLELALYYGCDGILFADDIAGNRGLMVSPRFLKNYYFKVVSNFLDQIHRENTSFIFHSDGNIVELTDTIYKSGFSGIQCLQPSTNISINSFSNEQLQKLCFWGNFEFEMKNSELIETEVTQLLKDWSVCSRYIFSSSGGLYEGISKERVKNAYLIVDNYRKNL